MQRILSFEQTPPLSVPLRFFLTAPLFAALAAGLLFWHGADALASRWSPLTLALTHLLTLGFLTMVMIGALIQILQVVVGIEIPRPRATAAGVHSLLSLGCLLLVAGFLLSVPTLFKLALPCLLGAILWLLVACGAGLWRLAQPTATVAAIRLSLAALAITGALGAVAAAAFAWPLALPLVDITNLHAGWGLLGWVGLLVIGIAYQVVPMFQVTPLYPVLVTRWLAGTMFLLLLVWSASWLLPQPGAGWLAHLALSLTGAGYLVFAASTLILLHRRKRPKPDATTLFWRTSLVSLAASALLWQAGAWLPAVGAASWLPVLLAILFIIGCAGSVINGMLYKIVPFLIWYHLQNQMTRRGEKAPNVRQIITDRAAERQFYVHLLALALLGAAPLWPDLLARAAAAMFGISSCWLWWNLVQATRLLKSASSGPGPQPMPAASA